MKREKAVEEFIKKWNMSIIEKPPHSISIGNSIWIYQNSKVKADLDGDILTSDHFYGNIRDLLLRIFVDFMEDSTLQEPTNKGGDYWFYEWGNFLQDVMKAIEAKEHKIKLLYVVEENVNYLIGYHMQRSAEEVVIWYLMKAFRLYSKMEQFYYNNDMMLNQADSMLTTIKLFENEGLKNEK